MVDDAMITRHAMIGAAMRLIAGGAFAGMLLPVTAMAAAPPLEILVYKDPSCACCTKWVEHLRANGFSPTVKDRTDMNALKDTMGVPLTMRSCHTALVGKYVIEGHVPASDIKRLLATTPKDIAGLAAPGMPSGSPGMEMPGKSDHYNVMAFTATAKSSVFVTHG